MFKAIISAALVFAFGSVAFANEPAPAPAHDEHAAPAASAKKPEKKPHAPAHGEKHGAH